MSSRDHISTVWHAYDAAYNRRDVAAALACFAPDYRNHLPGAPEPLGLADFFGLLQQLGAIPATAGTPG